MDFAAIDQKSGLRKKDVLQGRVKVLGYKFVSQFVHDWYYIKEKRPKEIAWELRVSYQSVYRWLAAWGFAPPGKNFAKSYGKASSFRGKMGYEPACLSAFRALWVAVVEQNIYDLKHGDETALAWFMNTENEDCPSFIWVAEALGLDPGAIRERMGVVK